MSTGLLRVQIWVLNLQGRCKGEGKIERIMKKMMNSAGVQKYSANQKQTHGIEDNEIMARRWRGAACRNGYEKTCGTVSRKQLTKYKGVDEEGVDQSCSKVRNN